MRPSSDRCLLAACTAIAMASFVVAAAPTHLILSSYVSKSCDPTQMQPFNVSVPLGSCLNNHDFNKPSCETMSNCIGQLTDMYGSTFPYESLVNCSGPPSMSLSVFPEWDAEAFNLEVKVYFISKACWGIPIPMHFTAGQCASQFALSGACGMAGSSVAWA